MTAGNIIYRILHRITKWNLLLTMKPYNNIKMVLVQYIQTCQMNGQMATEINNIHSLFLSCSCMAYARANVTE